MELWRYYRILRRRKWLIIFGMLLCTGITYAVVWRAPQIYAARGTLMERHQGGETGVPVFRDQGAMQLNTEMQLANLGSILTSDTVVRRTTFTLLEFGMTLTPDEIIGNTTVQPKRGTEILAVEVRSTDSREAVDGANVLISEFIQFYRELVTGATGESKKFIENQLPAAKARLDEAQQELKQYKEANDVTMLDAQNSLMLQRAMSTQN